MTASYKQQMDELARLSARPKPNLHSQLQMEKFLRGEDVGYPDSNPKTVIGVTKVPLHLVPPSAKHYLALAFKDGAKKYGPYNWRDNKVSCSVYVGAAQRHLDAFWDGEDLSRDAKAHHLGHVMACCAIILDAMSIEMLNDDRPTKGAASDLQEAFAKGE